MKTIEAQLAQYKSVHLDKRNIKTHFVGIPLIIWSAFTLLASIPFTLAIGTWLSLGLAGCVALVVLVYYAFLHLRLALGMLIVMIPLVYSAQWASQLEYGLPIAVAMFIVGWIFQGVGHKFEGAKPAFVDDINQLLIGPIFLMAELYFMLGWESELLAEITPKAEAIRLEIEQKKQTLI
ncbi:DUF962 domain-containing protein [Shewanella sp. NIFS-20-20]|uniref:Mpo1 family 2-hydroxy fatty acid dioxygenase n=1 Tax=Shewanella sp. NIFS-20-20 TaxID=2853806 RepID=UPI001C46D454|nr:Mpo1-like protein [Shewanella sp. NIFS-20-20]MBV7314223.1 DUF962 domain-containing protein [Shewanella sp. NIFS-20-20]